MRRARQAPGGKHSTQQEAQASFLPLPLHLPPTKPLPPAKSHHKDPRSLAPPHLLGVFFQSPHGAPCVAQH
jgi:hypothetical protein